MRWWTRLRPGSRSSRFEREMRDELEFHLDARANDLMARGLSDKAARRQAQLEFGAVESWKDSCREARGWTLWRDLRSDVRYAIRWLRRSPAFATAALLSLALGVGANTLVFSAVNALVLRPLPVERPSEVFFLESRRGPSHSFPNYRALRERGRSAATLAGYRIAPMNVTLPQGAVRIWGYLATSNYFDMLGIQPAAGRLFHDDDDRRPGASPYVVLSHDCWRTRFFADAGVVGRSLAVNGRPFTILGVAPPGFYGTERFYRAEMWVPIMMQAEIEPGNPWLEARNTSNTWVIGRANPGMSFAAVESALNIAGQDLAREYPNETRALQFKLTTPGIIGDALGTPVRAFALGVQALAGLVLLVACLNVAGLLLARGSDRQRELSIRLSIGAGRWRLMRQLLTESLLIAAAGGALGALIAVVGARVVSAWRAPVDFPVVLDVRADATVLLFAIVVVTFAGLVFGVAPARQAARTDPNLALKGSPGSRHGSRRLWMFRESLVAVQVALCCVLVSACLLSLIGLRRAVTLPIGFNPDGVAMAGVDLALAGYDQSRGEAFQRLMLDTISRLPGVESAAYSNSLPLTIDQSTTSIWPADQTHSAGTDRVSAIYYQVSPGFFRTMGIPIVAGREFTWSDAQTAPRVAVVNRSFARAVLRSSDPVGGRFPYGRDSFVEVVGLVEDGKYQSLAENPRPAIFWPMLQSYNSTTLVLVRSSLPADGMVQSLRQAIATVDPALPIHGAGTAQEMLRFARFPSRAAAMALGAFGFLAMTLAAVGLHGVVAYVVARREREIGIRLAIGARPNSVLRLVLVRMGLVLGAGSLIGLTLVLLAGGAIGAVVPEASPRNPGVIALAMAGMLGIGVAAAWSPARRALRISLTSALRSE